MENSTYNTQLEIMIKLYKLRERNQQIAKGNVKNSRREAENELSSLRVELEKNKKERTILNETYTKIRHSFSSKMQIDIHVQKQKRNSLIKEDIGEKILTCESKMISIDAEIEKINATLRTISIKLEKLKFWAKSMKQEEG